MKIITIVTLIFLVACRNQSGLNLLPIDNFDLNRYLGKWYEIARTDNSFEKGCTNVTAEYSSRKDSGVDVVNKCLLLDKQKVATGRAYFKHTKNIGALKVTFFWPFYGNYNISYIDENYEYAIVDGGSKEYLWILSRNKSIDSKTLKMLLEKIRNSGFDTDSLIYTSHND